MARHGANGIELGFGGGPQVGGWIGPRGIYLSYLFYRHLDAVAPDSESKLLQVFEAGFAYHRGPRRNPRRALFEAGVDVVFIPATDSAGIGFHLGVGIEQRFGSRYSATARLLYRGYSTQPRDDSTDPSYFVHLVVLEVDVRAHINAPPPGACGPGTNCIQLPQ